MVFCLFQSLSFAYVNKYLESIAKDAKESLGATKIPVHQNDNKIAENNINYFGCDADNVKYVEPHMCVGNRCS